MIWRTFTSLDSFLAPVRHFLEDSPAENCLPLGIIETWRTKSAPDKKSPFLHCGLERSSDVLVRAVFLQSLKATIVCGRPTQSACVALPELLAGFGLRSSGVVEPIDTVVNIAEHWASLPGGPGIRHRSMERLATSFRSEH